MDKPQETPQSIPAIENLRLGLLMECQRLEAAEPQQVAIGSISFATRHVQRQWQYCSEISRTLREMKLTIHLASNLSKQIVIDGIETKDEDLMLYHQGVFLDLLHQLKDKLFQLLYFISNDNPVEPLKKTKEQSFWNKCGDKITAIGIESLVKEWFEASGTEITRGLKKRTPHHHFVSPLGYDEELSYVRLSRTMAIPNMSTILSEEGKKYFAARGEEAMQKFSSEAIKKMQNTLNKAEENINNIAEVLVTFRKLPVSEEEMKKIIKEHEALTEKLTVKNTASLDNLPAPIRQEIKRLAHEFQQNGPDLIEAIYVTGDPLRGENIRGLRSFKIVLVTKYDFLDERKNSQLFDDMRAAGFDVELIGLERFQGDSGRRTRFLCWSDGVRLMGPDLIGNEKFPKPGLHLAWLLNQDMPSVLSEAEEWAKQNPAAPPLKIAQKSKILARRMLDFIYGIVLSNSAGYTPGTREKIIRINEMYPENESVIYNIVGVIRLGVGDLENFNNLIVGFRPNFELSYEKMKTLLEEISAKKEDGLQ